MLVFVKLGGSLITDKTRESTFLADRMEALAAAIQAARTTRPDMQLLVGHGSGSFGHFAASKYGTMAGVHTEADWLGFAEVGRTAARLNRLVTDALAAAGIPAWTVQPSASAECTDGDLRYMDARPLERALARGLVPLVHGDVALDTVRGGTIISTESIFFYLAPILRPQHIFLLGEVNGVLDTGGAIIPKITPDSLPRITESLGGSRGIDVTGGMATKVRDMVNLARRLPQLTIHIMSGREPDVVRESLSDPASAPGTVITAS